MKKILIIREASTNPDVDEKNIGPWELPGGRMSLGELPEEALRREVKEETGLEITIHEPLAVTEWQPVIRGEKVQNVAIYHCCVWKSGEVVVSNEHDEFAWIDPAEYRKYDFIPNVVPILEKHLQLRLPNG